VGDERVKNIFKKILMSVCLIFLFAGCAEKVKYEPTEVNNVGINISNVSSTGATIKIKDTNKYPHYYGYDYIIEKKVNDVWKEVTPITDDIAFSSDALLPNDHGEIEFVVDWESVYGELTSGSYRLLKNIGNKYISVEFSLPSNK
jgi:hypothetical protein